MQIEKFADIVDRVSDLDLPYIHCMNSAGALWQKPYGNIARIGIVLYGAAPSDDYPFPDGIHPALKWKSVVSMVKTITMGESIGYGRTYIAEHNMRVATIPTGYADGYNRKLSNSGYVVIGGEKAPIVGNVCMDQFMVDISAIDNVNVGDEVLLIGDQYTVDDMARDVGTIGYEILCGISKRVPRIYLKK